MLGTTAASFLGLTLRCVRCHDHKFEPLKQTEYYRMLEVFEPLKRPQENKAETDRLVGTEAELIAYRKAMAQADAAIAPVRQELDQQKKTLRDRLFKKKDASFPGVPFLEHAEIVLAFQTEPGKRRFSMESSPTSRLGVSLSDWRARQGRRQKIRLKRPSRSR